MLWRVEDWLPELLTYELIGHQLYHGSIENIHNQQFPIDHEGLIIKWTLYMELNWEANQANLKQKFFILFLSFINKYFGQD